MALFLFVPIGRPFNPNRSLISQNCSVYKITLCINIYRTLFHSQKRKWLMTNDYNDWNSWSLCFMLAASMFHACGLYVSRLRPLCFMLAASIYDTWLRQGEDCVLGHKEAIRGACCALWLWEASLQTTGLGSCFGLVLWGSCFSVVLFVIRALVRAFRGSCFSVVLFVVRAFGRSFRGSCFWVRAFGRSFVVRSSGSCFWGFVCVFFRCFKILRGVCGKVRGFLMQR